MEHLKTLLRRLLRCPPPAPPPPAPPVAPTPAVALPPPPPPTPAPLVDVVELNVGGRLFTTTRATLSAQPGSMLEALFSGRHARPCLTDAAGRPFLDRDGELFAEARALLPRRRGSSSRVGG